MSAVAEKLALTFEEFLERPDHDFFELVNGELVEIHVSVLSSIVAARIISRLVHHCDQFGAGVVMSSELYYKCFPDRPKTGRRPDASFVRAERATTDWLELGYSRIAPDLAVEVISTHDLAHEVARKTAEYQSVGVRLIWNIDPENRMVDVHRLDGSVTRLLEGGRLDGEDVLPRFSCPVAELFPKAADE